MTEHLEGYYPCSKISAKKQATDNRQKNAYVHGMSSDIIILGVSGCLFVARVTLKPKNRKWTNSLTLFFLYNDYK